MNNKLIKVLTDVLGTYENSTKNNIAFYCPFHSHHKRKMIINLELGHYHCWVCNRGGRKLTTLFKTLKVNHEYIIRLLDAQGLSTANINNLFSSQNNDFENILRLPAEFKSFLQSKDSIWYTAALNYLKKDRGLSNYDIIKYYIGYCDSGPFKNKIIVPSYDKSGILNYYVSRDFVGSEIKFKNPKRDKSSIVPHELYINWKLPIVLVEGVFDAITVKRNVIPLYGKVIPEELKKKIITEHVKEIYVCLDQDAFVNAIKTCEDLMKQGITVYFVNLQDKDPDKIGFEEITKILKCTPPLTFSELIKYKLQI